jgi:hypothetical protein
MLLTGHLDTEIAGWCQESINVNPRGLHHTHKAASDDYLNKEIISVARHGKLSADCGRFLIDGDYEIVGAVRARQRALKNTRIRLHGKSGKLFERILLEA